MAFGLLSKPHAPLGHQLEKQREFISHACQESIVEYLLWSRYCAIGGEYKDKSGWFRLCVSTDVHTDTSQASSVQKPPPIDRAVCCEGGGGWGRFPEEVTFSLSLERLKESSQEGPSPGREKCLAKSRERNHICSQRLKDFLQVETS